MARCPACGKEMLIAKGCGCSKVKINGKEYERIKVGDTGDFFEGEDHQLRCGDCGATMGHYHHWGCDCERCPVCGGQMICCECGEDVYVL